MATIENKRFTKFRLQLELLASHTSYNPEDFVFKYSYNNVAIPTRNFGDIQLHEVRYRLCDYFIIEYFVGNVRLLETYDLKVNGCLDDCSDVVSEIVSLITDVIDCVTVSFTDNDTAKTFMSKYLDRGSRLDGIISEEFVSKDTIVYYYVGSDFIMVYTKDFKNRDACSVNKYFVVHLVETNLLNDINVKNFKLIKHYTDLVYSDKDTEIAYY